LSPMFATIEIKIKTVIMMTIIVKIAYRKSSVLRAPNLVSLDEVSVT